MRVLVCGGRDFRDLDRMFKALGELNQQEKITEVIEGDAKGADRMAGDWAKLFGVRLTVVPADWERQGRRAGFLRNTAMANLKPDLVLAFPGGAGTAMMKRIAKDRGIQVIEA